MKNMSMKLGIMLLVVLQSGFLVASAQHSWSNIELDILQSLVDPELSDQHENKQAIQSCKKQKIDEEICKDKENRYATWRAAAQLMKTDISSFSEQEQAEIKFKAEKYKKYLEKRRIAEAQRRAKMVHAANLVKNGSLCNYSEAEQLEIRLNAERYKHNAEVSKKRWTKRNAEVGKKRKEEIKRMAQLK